MGGKDGRLDSIFSVRVESNCLPVLCTFQFSVMTHHFKWYYTSYFVGKRLIIIIGNKHNSRPVANIEATSHFFYDQYFIDISAVSLYFLHQNSIKAFR